MSGTGRVLYHGALGCTIAFRWSLVALMLLTACPGRGGGTVLAPASMPVEETAVPIDELGPYFVAGEQITWEVTFLGVQGGRARLAVGTPGLNEGRRVLGVVAQAESAGVLAAVRKVRDDVESWIDLETGLPTRTDSEVEMKGKKLVVKATRRAGNAVADLLVKRGNGRETKEAKRLPDIETHDPLSAILLLRGWHPAAGARAMFYTLGGLRIWRTDLVVEGREEIDCPLGKRAAVRMSGVSRRMLGTRVDPKSKARSFTLWLSDDPQRIPLRIVAKTEYGEIVVQATSYDVPVVGRR